MKEATGELNATLIVVMAVAALAALFFTVIWPMIRNDIKYDSNCSNAVCDPGLIKDNTGVRCYYYDENKNVNELDCPYTG